jgi:hypothetical protein
MKNLKTLYRYFGASRQHPGHVTMRMIGMFFLAQVFPFQNPSPLSLLPA